MSHLDLGKETDTKVHRSGSIDRLIAEQGVKPIQDIDDLITFWPSDDDPDRLLDYVLSERKARLCNTSGNPD